MKLKLIFCLIICANIILYPQSVDSLGRNDSIERIFQSGAIDSMVDTVMGKQEYKFQKSIEEQAEGDYSALRQFLIDSLMFVYQERMQNVIDSLLTIFEDTLMEYRGDREYYHHKLDSLYQASHQRILTLEDSIKHLVTKATGMYDQELEAKFFNFLKQIRSLKFESGGLIGKFLKRDKDDDYSYKIELMNEYLNMYLLDARADYVLKYMIDLDKENSKWENIGLHLVKFLFLFTDSPLYNEVKQECGKLFERERYFRSFYRDYLELVTSIIPYKEQQLRYYNFVLSLEHFPDENVRKHFPEEVANFLRLYPQSRYCSELLKRLAEWYEEGEEYEKAVITYKRLATVYSSFSEYVPYAIYRIGCIYEERFSNPELAIKYYDSLKVSFPRDTMVDDAIYRKAELLASELRDYLGACSELESIPKLFPDSPIAARALLRAGGIYYDILNATDKSIECYEKIVSSYPLSSEAPQALFDCGKIFEAKGEYNKAIKKYRTLYTDYKASDLAPEAMVRTARIYEEKLNDIDKAIEIYSVILSTFPETKEASLATRKIKQLQQKKE